MANLVNLSHP